MEPFTLDRDFHKQNIIDGFQSLIWTERYYGDSGVELVVPASAEMIEKLPEGILLGLDDSDEIMLIETAVVKNQTLKLTGMSILPWLNNRFIRTTDDHEDRYWYLSGMSVGDTIWTIVYNMCIEGSPYLDGTENIGIPDPETLAIPGLEALAVDTSGPAIEVGVPFGPVYNGIREIAVTYETGIQIVLVDVTPTDYILGFRVYRGVDRTSGQTVVPTVRFSPVLDSLTDIEELRSIAVFKTNVYVFAPNNPDGLATTPGISILPGYSGFDLRALMVHAEDITTDMVGADPDNLLNILNSRANKAIRENRFIQAVDGVIVPNSQLKYGIDYNLGDIVEIQGYSGIVQSARVTEFVRTKDSTGTKAYPTIEMIGS